MFEMILWGYLLLGLYLKYKHWNSKRLNRLFRVYTADKWWCQHNTILLQKTVKGTNSVRIVPADQLDDSPWQTAERTFRYFLNSLFGGSILSTHTYLSAPVKGKMAAWAHSDPDLTWQFLCS